MTETEYLRIVDEALDAVEDALDRSPIGADCARAGRVLTIELDGGATIVVNAQAPTQQLWLAARSGGWHFAYDGTHWHDLRTGIEFFEALSRALGEALGREVTLGA